MVNDIGNGIVNDIDLKINEILCINYTSKILRFDFVLLHFLDISVVLML